jgi:hypothetical protein
VGQSSLGNANFKECSYSPTHDYFLLSNERVVQGSIVKKDIYVFNYVIIVESVH